MTTYLGAQGGLDGDIIIMGLPFDHGSTTHAGSAAGPQVFRQLTSFLGLNQGYVWDQQTRRKTLDKSLITDAGNLPYKAMQSKESYIKAVKRAASEIFKARKTPVFLGGDHLMTYPLVAAAGHIFGQDFQVVHVDAHLDIQRREEGDLPTHANFVSFAVEEARPKRWIQLGIRTLSREMPDVAESVVSATPETLESTLIPNLPIYLTIDVDGFDPSIVPAVGHPVPGGLQWQDFTKILETIEQKDCSILGADWMEYNPRFDSENYLCAQSIISKQVELLQFLSHSK